MGGSGLSIGIADRRLVDPEANHWPPPDRAERQLYHGEQAARAEKEKQWFAAAFHLGRLLIDDPDNAQFKERRQQAQERQTTGIRETKEPPDKGKGPSRT